MKNITKKDLTDTYFISQLNRFTNLTHLELNLSAIMAGFSLGAVVALLLIDKSNLVRAMFILSNIASSLFVLSTLYHFMIEQYIQDFIVYIDYFETKKEKFTELKKINKKSSYASAMFGLGLLSFSAVLICSCFMYSTIFGLVVISIYTPILFFILASDYSSFEKKIINIKYKYDIFSLTYEEIPD
jgi:uncharacterized membrane protein (DUF4010 family)